jgi:hypothetical protein
MTAARSTPRSIIPVFNSVPGGNPACPLVGPRGPSYAAAGALRSGAASLRTTLPRAACTVGRRCPTSALRTAARVWDAAGTNSNRAGTPGY